MQKWLIFKKLDTKESAFGITLISTKINVLCVCVWGGNVCNFIPPTRSASWITSQHLMCINSPGDPVKMKIWI